MDNRLLLAEKLENVRLYSANSQNQNPSHETRQALYHKGVISGKWGKIGVERGNVPSVRTIQNIYKLFDDTG